MSIGNSWYTSDEDTSVPVDAESRSSLTVTAGPGNSTAFSRYTLPENDANDTPNPAQWPSNRDPDPTPNDRIPFDWHNIVSGAATRVHREQISSDRPTIINMDGYRIIIPSVINGNDSYVVFQSRLDDDAELDGLDWVNELLQYGALGRPRDGEPLETTLNQVLSVVFGLGPGTNEARDVTGFGEGVPFNVVGKTAVISAMAGVGLDCVGTGLGLGREACRGKAGLDED
nr:hypothetical protein L203_00528 [Cryptococcus depauperatus CBS 7841]